MALTKEQTDHTIDINGMEIHYNEAGSGPALICTHGGGPGANAWDNTRWSFDKLAEKFRVILMDFPGFGGSQKLVKREGVPMDQFCAKIQHDFMDKLGIDKAHLYGSSAFSATPLRFGIEYPDRVGRIVIQAWSPVGGHQTEGLKSLGVFAQNPVRENMVKMMEYFIPRAELRPDSFIDSRFQMALTPGHLESRREFSGQSNGDMMPDLPKLKTDVLIVWGAADGVIPVEGALDALKHIPNSRAYIWGDNTGHFVCYEHPDEFADLLTAFLLHG
jgi:4,5:9,10-diseco-3-hydroxy-5,9,17-trioxoandrosta-1(10),2-diene-4-oate hydrolase